VTGATGVALAAWLLLAWATWPDVAALASTNPRTTAFIDRARADGARIRWTWVPDAAISVHLKRAVVAAEDMEFFSHDGFSGTEIRAAVRDALQEGRKLRGASTITQQLAKNLWLSPSRDPLRKLREVLLTRQLEEHLSKRRILEIYLNVVELGPGVYGAEAAARHYFGTSAGALSEMQAAELAAALPRPATWHPGTSSGAYRRYVADILRRMDRADFLWRHVQAS
jgi:monofunctional biosynthetic peptidoglycan transglycosylase